jgi:hypothetical protein
MSFAFIPRSSMKNKYRDFHDINGNETLPQKLFKGTFVVFTVIALLELPNGVSIFNWVFRLGTLLAVGHA